MNILLPPDAKEIATRFRWWQPRHDGLDQNDWAIDNVLISGSADQRTVMLDTFSSAPVPQHERSPADAGPVGRIAFDMFMEDKTSGKLCTVLNKKPSGNAVVWIWIFSKERSVEPFQMFQWCRNTEKGVILLFLSAFLVGILTKSFLSFKPASVFLYIAIYNFINRMIFFS